MNQEELLVKVNQVTGNDYTHSTFLSTIADLVQMVAELKQEIESYQLQETLLLGRLEKLTLEYKQLKQDRRLIAFYEMAEENLKMAEELALLKGELSG